MKASEVLDNLKRRFPNEPEYHQAVSEVLGTIEEGRDSGETAIQRPARRAGRSIPPLGHRSPGKRGAGVPGCRMRPERALCARRRALPPEKGDFAERAAYATLPRGLSFRRRHRA